MLKVVQNTVQTDITKRQKISSWFQIWFKASIK